MRSANKVGTSRARQFDPAAAAAVAPRAHRANLDCMSRARRWLALEWAVYGRRVRVVFVVLVLFAAGLAFEVTEALLPHNVQNTKLKYEEKSNGIREYWGTGVDGLPSPPASQRAAP
jgi:hypothetical protein